MNTATSDPQSLVARIERLEKQNRFFKGGGLAVLLSVAALVLMGQARPNRTVEAEKFTLRDSRGQVRATLGIESEDRPTLSLYDAKGWPLVSLAGEEYPFLVLSRAGSKEEVMLLATKDLYGLAIYGEPKGAKRGTRIGLAVVKGVPALSLYDENANERASIQTEPSGPSLKLTDKDGKAGFGLWVAPFGGPDFSMYDASGKLRVDLVAPVGEPSLKLEDENGYSAIFGSTDLVNPATGRKETTSAASLTLFGKDRKVLWSTP